jgi:hypothetical protein
MHGKKWEKVDMGGGGSPASTPSAESGIINITVKVSPGSGKSSSNIGIRSSASELPLVHRYHPH